MKDQDVLFRRKVTGITQSDAMASLELNQAIENSLTLKKDDSENGKQVVLPRQLEVVPKATELPSERHRWNTNEEVAGILIAFEKHHDWQSKDVKLRPPSGSMLLYNRKKARYRKDGYCWKKRKDGKTTREDHMKLKVQSVECIYGCYVHSAVLPTFHRRCYWLLQNPDIVLVHYLNVPLNDNKLPLPSLANTLEKKEWTKEELILQLTPMFVSARHEEVGNVFLQQTEDTIHTIVQQLLDTQKKPAPRTHECGCPASVPCDKQDCKNKSRIISPKSEAASAASTPTPNQKHLISLVGQKQTAGGATGTNALTQGGIQGLYANSAAGNHHHHHQSSGSASKGAGANAAANTTPLILNLSQLQGSNGLIILSSQSAAPISIINSSAGGSLSTSQATTATATVTTASSTTPEAMDHRTTASTQKAAGHKASGRGRSRISSLLANINQQAIRLKQQQQALAEVQNHQAANQALHTTVTAGSVSHNQVNLAGSLAGTAIPQSIKSEPRKVEDNLGNCGMNASSMNSDNMVHSTTDMEISMDISQPSSYSDRSMMATSQNSSPSLIVDLQVNKAHNCVHGLVEGLDIKPDNSFLLKNDHYVSDVGLQMTQEEIHRTLSANMPGGVGALGSRGQLGVADSVGLSNQHSSSIESMETMRTNMVSPQSADLNFDAFDILDLPEFESDHDVTSSSVATVTTTTAKTTAATVTTTTSSSCNGCHSNQAATSNNQTTPSTQQQVKVESRAGIANITDFSPEWSYSDGGVKILVTGPWYSTTSPYTVLFDGVSVEAQLVQSGVLRCFCPAHSPGSVPLQVACEGFIISNSCTFEYKSRETIVPADKQKKWFDIQEEQLKMAVLVKMEEIEKRLSPCTKTIGLISKAKLGPHPESFETRLVEYVNQLSQRTWSRGRDLIPATRMKLSLLHLLAALGYARLINALIKWRSDNPSLVLECEVDALSIDENACTPLMWSCARGKSEAALVLYHWNFLALYVCNKEGQVPLGVARVHGNDDLASHVEHLEIIRQESRQNLLGVQDNSNSKLSLLQLLQNRPSAVNALLMSMANSSHQTINHTAIKTTESNNNSLVGNPQSLFITIPDSQSNSSKASANQVAPPAPQQPHIPPRVNRGRLLKRTSVEVLTGNPYDLHTESSDGSHMSMQHQFIPSMPMDSNVTSCQTLTGVSPQMNVRRPVVTTRHHSLTIPDMSPFRTIQMAAASSNSNAINPINNLINNPNKGSSHTSVIDRSDLLQLGQSLQAVQVQNVQIHQHTGPSLLSSIQNLSTHNHDASHSDHSNLSLPSLQLQTLGGAAPATAVGAVGTTTGGASGVVAAATVAPPTHTPLIAPNRALSKGTTSSETRHPRGLRAVSSDPYLIALSDQMTSLDNPMLSVNSRDLNSPVFMDVHHHQGLCIEDLHQETIAMETDSVSTQSPFEEVEKLSTVEDDEMHHASLVENAQMMTLVNQIIEAMPERIKSSPSRLGEEEEAMMEETEWDRRTRERSSSHSSFSSYCSATTPPCHQDDSGISTPLEGLADQEYRYVDYSTPTSSLSPASSCLQSPYSFTLDSPPPTTAEFTEYFNAPTVFMEKDFSQLTLSDQEQRRLYEAAKVIQNFFRRLNFNRAQRQRQRQKEVEAAILIQSYYRRYKQYTYYRKMTQAAVLIQSQFRSYYAKKRFKRSRQAATVIQNQYRTYKEHERFKKSRNAAVIIQQRFRSHYQRKRCEQELARKMQQAISHSDPTSEADCDTPSTSRERTSTEREGKEGREKKESSSKENEVEKRNSAERGMEGKDSERNEKRRNSQKDQENPEKAATSRE